jgi:hypothetical protein
VTGDFRQFGSATGLTTSLTLHMEDSEAAWTVQFVGGEITALTEESDGDFLISGKPSGGERCSATESMHSWRHNRAN